VDGHVPRDSSRVPQAELFAAAARYPDGFVYREDFLTADDEIELLAIITRLPLREAQYRQYTAKRRTISYGSSYDFSTNVVMPAPPVAEFLLPLRERVAAWVGIAAADFAYALVTEYRPGTQLGWHRDVPHFGTVVGISLAGGARMRFRPWPPNRDTARARRFVLELQPRSAYVLQREIRWRWQHAISPTKTLRYSITFRTGAS
jgi:alkylated DNA repair dioxygenase AlkB